MDFGRDWEWDLRVLFVSGVADEEGGVDGEKWDCVGRGEGS